MLALFIDHKVLKIGNMLIWTSFFFRR